MIKYPAIQNISHNIHILTLQVAIIMIILLGSICQSQAGNRFTANYPCVDNGKHCISSGTKTIQGFEVHRDCWEFAYSKTCNYPSKNNCQHFAHCYAVADLPCLLRDNYGNCVNLHKEFSCKSWQPVTIDKETVRTGLVEKEGKDRLVCKGVACLDGNCVDKSYLTDADMMDSVSKLYAVSQMKGATDLNFKLFEGFSQSCSKKATSYTNCCSTGLTGWGKNLGARCTKDEIDLIDKRQKNLCVYVGKENKQTMGITTIVKHHYCCFGSLLNKVIQVEGRKQLGINFGSGKHTNCRGLTLAEIMRLDFNKMDFSEFFADILKRMKLPKIGDINARMNSVLPNIKKYDGNPDNKKNNMTGWSKRLQDDSWEAVEEGKMQAAQAARAAEQKRLEAQQIENERLAAIEQQRQEAIRLEQARQAEQQRLAMAAEQERQKQEAAKRIRRAELERKLLQAKADEAQADSQFRLLDATRPPAAKFFDPAYAEWRKVFYQRQATAGSAEHTRKNIEAQLKDGNY